MSISIASARTAQRNRTARPTPMTVLKVWSERRALANMSSSRLKDMGISPSKAAAEAARPFWDLPKTRG